MSAATCDSNCFPWSECIHVAVSEESSGKIFRWLGHEPQWLPLGFGSYKARKVVAYYCFGFRKGVDNVQSNHLQVRGSDFDTLERYSVLPRWRLDTGTVWENFTPLTDIVVKLGQ